MSKQALRGVIAASITPVTAAGTIDVPRLARHVTRLLGDGCTYVSTFGTTGEGASISTHDKVAALRALAHGGADMSRQVPAVMTPVLDDAAETLKAIAELGCRAALVLPPFYYPTSEAGIADFFDALIARVPAAHGLDLRRYNIPQLSRVRFTPSLVSMLLSRHPGRVVGIKDSTGDLASGLELIRHFPQLAIMTGDDRVLPELVRRGGAGMIGGMPNVFARELAALYSDPDGPRAADLLARQAERISIVDAGGSLLALKSAVAYYAGDAEFARALPPLIALTPTQQGALAAAFEATGYTAVV